MSIYLQQHVNHQLKLFAFLLNVPKAVTIWCTWTVLYIICRLKYTTAKQAFLKFFFSVLKGSYELIANSKYAIVERQSLFAPDHKCVSILFKTFPQSRLCACCDCCSCCLSGNQRLVLSTSNVKTNLCSRAALVNPLCPPPNPPPSSTSSRSLQRPRGTALPGKRPHAHVCQVSLHLPATSRCRTGVQSCTEGHAVSGPDADLISNLSRLGREKVFVVMVCQLFDLLCGHFYTGSPIK